MGFLYKAKGSFPQHSIWLWHLHSLQKNNSLRKRVGLKFEVMILSISSSPNFEVTKPSRIFMNLPGKMDRKPLRKAPSWLPSSNLSAYQQVSQLFSPTWSGPKIKVVKCIMGELHPSPRVFLAMFAGFFVDVLGGRCFFWGHWGLDLAFLSVALFWGCINGVSKIFEPTKKPNESCKTYPVTVDELTPTTEDQLTF